MRGNLYASQSLYGPYKQEESGGDREDEAVNLAWEMMYTILSLTSPSLKQVLSCYYYDVGISFVRDRRW
jgi:hypothetical protein